MTASSATSRSSDRTWIAFLALAIAAAGVLLWLGRGMTFFADEWAFIESRSLGDPASWLDPHNEHLVAVPAAVYRLLVETVGLGSYVPYHALLVGLHVLVGALVFRIVRRHTGSGLALAAAVIVLFLGSGFENLYWAFQIGFVGATAAGLAAIDLMAEPMTRSGVLAVTVLLVVAVVSQGNALVFLTVVGVDQLLRRDGWSRVPVLAAPAVVYVVWLATIGRQGIGTFRDPLSIDSLTQIPRFVIDGAGNAFGAITGVGPVLGLLVAVGVLVLAAVLWWRRRTLPTLFVGCMAGIVVEYALIAITRAGVTVGQAGYTRYTYVSAVLAVIAVATLVGPDVQAILTRGGAGRRRLRVGVAITLGLALYWNGSLLLGGRQLFLERAEMTRALVAVATDEGHAPGIDRARSLVLVPSPVSLDRIVRTYGSPLSDALLPWAVEPIRPSVMAEAHRRLVEGAPVPPVSD